MGKGNYASNIRKIGKSYETDLTKPNIEGVMKCVNAVDEQFLSDTISLLFSEGSVTTNG